MAVKCERIFTAELKKQIWEQYEKGMLVLPVEDPDLAPGAAPRPIEVHIELTGDGAGMMRKIKTWIFCVKVIKTKSKSMECSPVHMVTIIAGEGPESHENFKDQLDAIRPAMDAIAADGLVINGVKFNVTFYLGGDLPFVAAVLGLVGHIHTYFCVWCLCMQSQLADLGIGENGTPTLIR